MRYPPVVMISSSRRLDQKLTLKMLLEPTLIWLCTIGDQQEIQQLEINIGV